MAGIFERSPNKRLIGRETEEAWLERMSQEGAIAPAENILAVQKALGAEAPKESFLGSKIKDLKAPSLPDIDWQAVWDFLKPKSAAEEIAKTKRTLSGN